MLKSLTKLKTVSLFGSLLGLLVLASVLSAQTVAETDALSQKGKTHRMAGRPSQALLFHHQAWEGRQKIFGQNSIEAANSLTNIGHCYNDLRYLDSAIFYYQKALSIQIAVPTLPEGQPLHIGDTYRCLADCQMAKGDFRQAQATVKMAFRWLNAAQATPRDFFVAEKTPFKGEGGQMRYAAALATEGQCRRYLGDRVGAVAHFQTALSLLPPNDPNRWVITSQLGTSYLDFEPTDSALFFFKKALSEQKANTSVPDKARLLTRIGDYYLSKKQSAEARSYYQKAIRLLSPALSPDLLGMAFNHLAKAYLLEKQNTNALQALERSLKILNDTLNAPPFFQRESFPLQRSLVDKGILWIGRYPLETIVALTEKAKVLQEMAFEKPSPQAWQTALAAYEAAIHYAETYERHITAPESALLLRGYFYERYGGAAEAAVHLGQPELAFAYAERGKGFLLKAQKNGDGQEHSLAMVRASLPSADATLLAYTFGQKNILLFVVNASHFQVLTLPKEGVAAQVQVLLKKIRNPFYRNPDPYFAQEAFDLYQKLVAPAQIKKGVALVIVPDGILNYLPFEVLISSLPASVTQFGSYAYLLKQNPISYRATGILPTAPKDLASKKVLAMVPQFYRHPLTLDSLKFSEKEVSRIGKLWTTEILRGYAATKTAFMTRAGQFQILHLSTHGIADDAYPEQSFLAFTSLSDSLEKAILTVADIEKMSLHADLVTLSACQTATGIFYGGEGLMSIGRAFMVAGCRSVVASLWNVNDDWAGQLTAAFYENLGKGYAKDRALQNAKQTLLTADDPIAAHPYFWSAFILSGNTAQGTSLEGEEVGKGRFRLWWLLGVLLFLFVVGFRGLSNGKLFRFFCQIKSKI
jgi:CHAT domain-containing protein